MSWTSSSHPWTALFWVQEVPKLCNWKGGTQKTQSLKKVWPQSLSHLNQWALVKVMTNLHVFQQKKSSCESLTLSRSRCIRRSISMVFQVFHATLLVLLLICQTWAIVQLPIDHLHPDNVGLRRLDGFNGFWNRQNGKTYWMHRIQNDLIGTEESIFSWNFRV